MTADRQLIEAGVRTVAHMAAYFEELKQAALDLQQRSGVSDRGYFTPSEEEATRHLLVSYWQARNALFELIMSAHDADELPEALKPSAFLVAYAGAILLVDVARFLRETFDENAVVRRKLNEPAPDFGIPARTYDTVQQSLTSPNHAWHLRQAARYFEEHQGELRQAADEELWPVLEAIDRLQDRTRVPLDEYLSARLQVRARQVVEGVRQTAVGQALYSLQELASRTVSRVSTSPRHRPGIPREVGVALRQVLEPGDVLVTRKEFVLTNYFLPGYWPHAALYLGDASDLQRLGIDGHENLKPSRSSILHLWVRAS